ncbi:MAG: hypothetical protein EOO21_00090, partial [Comamonadaceae bacterium]
VVGVQHRAQVVFEPLQLHDHDRMRSGDYGRCEQCDEPIPFARLQARPEARLCIRDEEAWERAHPQAAPVQAT